MKRPHFPCLTMGERRREVVFRLQAVTPTDSSASSPSAVVRPDLSVDELKHMQNQVLKSYFGIIDSLDSYEVSLATYVSFN